APAAAERPLAAALPAAGRPDLGRSPEQRAGGVSHPAGLDAAAALRPHPPGPIFPAAGMNPTLQEIYLPNGRKVHRRPGGRPGRAPATGRETAVNGVA